MKLGMQENQMEKRYFFKQKFYRIEISNKGHEFGYQKLFKNQIFH